MRPNEAPTKEQAAEANSAAPGDHLADFAAFRSALEAGQIGIWWWDLRAQQITWSTNLENFQGVRPNSEDGAFSLAADALPASDEPGLLAAMRKALETRAPCRLEYRLPAPLERDERWGEASITVIVESGAVVHMLGVCRDVTERLRVNREVRVRARQQETLARLGERALTEIDLQKFFDEVVATLAEILDTEMTKILELLPGDTELLLRAGVGWQPDLVGSAHVSTGRDSQSGYTLGAGRPVIVEDLPNEKRFSGQPLLKDHGVVSGVTTPISGQDGRAYGVLGAHTVKRRKFNDYDVAFLAAVANVIAPGSGQR